MPTNVYPRVVQIIDQSAEAARWDIAARVAKARFVAAWHLVPQGSDLKAGGFVSAAVRKVGSAEGKARTARLIPTQDQVVTLAILWAVARNHSC
jgi:hypothetical protein